jgi:hypothetical protein
MSNPFEIFNPLNALEGIISSGGEVIDKAGKATEGIIETSRTGKYGKLDNETEEEYQARLAFYQDQEARQDENKLRRQELRSQERVKLAEIRSQERLRRLELAHQRQQSREAAKIEQQERKARQREEQQQLREQKRQKQQEARRKK